MAVLSIFIGIMLALKNEKTGLPKNEGVIVFDEHVLPEEDDTPSSITEASGVSDKRDIIGTDSQANIIHGEPDYVDIEVNEAEDHEEQTTEDHSATSYEDELAENDDVEQVAGEAAQTEESDTTPETAEVETEELPFIENQSENRPAVSTGQIAGQITNAVEPADVSLSTPQDGVEIGEDISESEIKIAEPRRPRHYSYTVTRGDKLRDVLEQSGIGLATTKALERKFPQLGQLVAGQQFHWQIDADGDLESMKWLVSEKEEQTFERKEKNRFVVRVVEKQGVWKQDVVKGTISTDFISSLKSVGLSLQQINQLAQGLQWQIATNQLKKGDKFAILVKREYINGKVTDLGNVEAILVQSGNKSYYAIQADNGRYYNRQGETLGKGFARYPLTFTPRISSSFNPRRLHPVTKRLAPHKGADFAVPIGTPVIAPADGVVEHIAYQANGAGRYIKLRHGRQYTTVYMHLSKPLVSIGQHVRKGDRIALSGNTGRSTGAHLHYEFHINGNPVNPVTVKLPGTGSGMPENERKAFLIKAKNVEAKLKL